MERAEYHLHRASLSKYFISHHIMYNPPPARTDTSMASPRTLALVGGNGRVEEENRPWCFLRPQDAGPHPAHARPLRPSTQSPTRSDIYPTTPPHPRTRFPPFIYWNTSCHLVIGQPTNQPSFPTRKKKEKSTRQRGSEGKYHRPKHETRKPANT